MNDFFYDVEHSQVCNFADDSMIFACGQALDKAAKSLENDLRIINWNGCKPKKF